MSINTSFEFKSYKEQIESEVSRLKRFWEESNEEKKLWNEKYKKYEGIVLKKITDCYGILVTIEVYNAIREIYSCNSPYPRDTTDIFGLKVSLDNSKGNRGIIMVDKKEFVNVLEGEA